MSIDFKSFAIGLVVGAVAMSVVCVVLLFAVAWRMNHRDNAAGTPPAFCPVAGDEAVTQALKPIRQKFNVPAMVVAVVTTQ